MKKCHLLGGALTAALFLSSACAFGQSDDGDRVVRLKREGHQASGFPAPSILFQYPPEVTLQEARSEATFEVLFPTEKAANADNLSGAFLNSDGKQVFFKFPPLGDATGVRQAFIEIVEDPWYFKEEPRDVWADFVQRYPGYAEIIDLHGLDALVIKPMSPYDEERANPAYVRFRVKGLDVSVWGGDDVKALLTIADDLAAQALEEGEDL